MSTQQAIQLFQSLPSELQKEVVLFMEFLATKKVSKEKEDTNKKSRKPGRRKGFIKYMAEDFDGPLEDFKEYM